MANNIVVDASVLIAVVTNEPEKANLVQFTHNANLIVPPSIPWEIGNAFSAMLKRNRISLAEALNAIDAYANIPLRIVDIELDQTLKLVDELNIYAYDAYLIRCAIKYKSPLLSLDQSLVNSAKRVNALILEVGT